MPIPTSYTENALAQFIVVELSDVARSLGWDITTPEVREAINDALIACGVDTLSAITDIPKLRAFARVMGWRTAVKALSARYDFSTGNHRFSRTQALSGARASLTDAERDATAFGLPGNEVKVCDVVYTQDPYAPPVLSW